MKKTALILLVLLGSVGYSQTLDCSKFKNVTAYNPEFPNRSFMIKDNVQESYNNGVLQMVWDLKWLSECEYEVVCIKKLGETQIALGDRIVVTIISIDNECYTCKRVFYSKDFPEGDVDPKSTFCFKKN
ncbi:hypothetical protein [Flavobacterium sp. N3904]|uniref:hypothetical protein n=1 Tax=Flavobacterium sp. N3904 TaxID=2986835 RepID=UPI0022253E33|nr:hypothetical protein [Flavobacterium sp. N3904]